MLVFDGNCGFCTRSVGWVRAMDRRGRIQVRPYQEPGAPESIGTDAATCADAVQWRGPDGHRLGGAAAVNAVLDTVTADKIHRGHAIIEQVHPDLKISALAHLPSGVFTANAAWLVLAVIAFNLTRAAATLAAPAAASDLARATTATVRRKLIHIPCRIAASARRLTLHLPQNWPWQTAWTQLNERVADPPGTATS